MESNPLKIQASEDSSDDKSILTVENEWETFLKKVRAWLGNTNKISREFDDFINPSILIIGLSLLLICVKAYTTFLYAVGEIPFAASLFEVIGTLWLIKFSITRLLHKKDRHQFTSEIKNRWITFLGSKENKY